MSIACCHLLLSSTSTTGLNAHFWRMQWRFIRSYSIAPYQLQISLHSWPICCESTVAWSLCHIYSWSNVARSFVVKASFQFTMCICFSYTTSISIGGSREAIRIGVHLFDHAQCNRILHSLLRYWPCASPKSFARSIQSCQRHILLGARVIKGIFCHVQGLFNIVKGVLSLNRRWPVRAHFDSSAVPDVFVHEVTLLGHLLWKQRCNPGTLWCKNHVRPLHQQQQP